MADQLLEKARDVFEGQIDFEGQEMVELLATFILSLTGGFSFLCGYLFQDIQMALRVFLGGMLLTMFIVVPPWPFYNRNPVKWLPVGGREKDTSITVDGQVIG